MPIVFGWHFFWIPAFTAPVKHCCVAIRSSFGRKGNFSQPQLNRKACTNFSKVSNFGKVETGCEERYFCSLR